jgi:hypothetical protein
VIDLGAVSTSFSRTEPATAAQIARCEHELGVALAPEHAELLMSMNGF